MSKPICPGCDKPMISGQAMNGLYGCHWDCTDKVRTQELDEKAQDTIDARKKHDQEKARAVLEERMPHVLEHQVLGSVVERLEEQLETLEELIEQIPDSPKPIYSCLVDSRDSIACYDTKGAEGKPGFAICALHPKEKRTTQSVVLDVEDSQALSDQLVSFLVGHMPEPPVFVDFHCESLDKEGFSLYSNGSQMVLSVLGNTETVHLGRDSAKAMRDRLNQFLEETK